MLYVPLTFISTHLFVLSCLTVYYLLIIHYYIIILIWIRQYFSVFLLEIYIFLLIFPFHFPLSLKYPVVNFLDFCNFIINFITNQLPFVSDFFWIAVSEVVLSASVIDFLAWSRRLWLYLLIKFLLLFYQCFCPYL